MPSHKGKGAKFPAECRPSLSVFSKIRLGCRITTLVTERLGKTFELSPSFPEPPDITSVVRVHSLPFLRLVADSLEGHSLLSPLRKISLPLQRWNRGSAIGLQAAQFLAVEICRTSVMVGDGRDDFIQDLGIGPLHYHLVINSPAFRKARGYEFKAAPICIEPHDES